MKNYTMKLHIDVSVRPIAQPVRRIASGRREKVCDKLEELEKLGVIEKVSGSTSWLNPFVPVEKQNGDVRICLDMGQAKQAIIRERHSGPTVEKKNLQETSGARVFANLDINMAFLPDRTRSQI